MLRRAWKKIRGKPSTKPGESGPSSSQDEGPPSSARALSDSSYSLQLEDPLLSPSDTTSYSTDVYTVSYRLSTQESDNYLLDSLQYRTMEEVLSDVAEDSITHFRCKGKIPPLNILCPMVKELRLENIPENCQLESISSLTQLKELGLSDNNFKEGLPEVVGTLTSLPRLYLDRCQLQSLPDFLSSLTQLNVLWLSGNNFEEGLPGVVGALTYLTELYLDSCQLQDLPEFLSFLTQLKVLVLSDNNFKEGLPEVVGALTSLSKLHLNRCQLQDLPESSARLGLPLLGLALTGLTLTSLFCLTDDGSA
ncbi:leucine-rich repeat-containing protein 1-like [Watersipora subatra]|uniref:leucine-rich repeat-containing protein 1-like n=1 Tax=Watersipora subatra TaxID=2589382 RepID=UPI00355BC11E